VTDVLPGPLAAELPGFQQLAVAYAPRAARGPWVALLALDRRLARAAIQASEPMLGQIRLVWWRDRLRTPASAWPEGEPLLAALAGFDADRAALEALVDAWETLVGGQPDPNSLAALGDARAGALSALARLLRCDVADAALSALAQRWTLAELAGSLGGERPVARLPRAMRPLAILAELAGNSDLPRSGTAGLRRLWRIIRLGTLGR